MNPVFLKLVRAYGPKILKQLNELAKGMNRPLVPTRPLNSFEKAMGMTEIRNPLSRMHRANILDSAKLVQKYPYLFRSTDVRYNVKQASEVKKALQGYKFAYRDYIKPKTSFPNTKEAVTLLEEM